MPGSSCEDGSDLDEKPSKTLPDKSKKSKTQITRHANAGPPPGKPKRPRLDKDLLELDVDGDESEGGTQRGSKKPKHDTDNQDNSSSPDAGTPPLTSSNNNNNAMFFFCFFFGGGDHT